MILVLTIVLFYWPTVRVLWSKESLLKEKESWIKEGTEELGRGSTIQELRQTQSPIKQANTTYRFIILNPAI